MHLFEYVKLLREHKDPNAKEVREFVAKHKDDPVLTERIKTLDALHLMKLALAEHEMAEEPT